MYRNLCRMRSWAVHYTACWRNRRKHCHLPREMNPFVSLCAFFERKEALCLVLSFCVLMLHKHKHRGLQSSELIGKEAQDRQQNPNGSWDKCHNWQMQSRQSKSKHKTSQNDTKCTMRINEIQGVKTICQEFWSLAVCILFFVPLCPASRTMRESNIFQTCHRCTRGSAWVQWWNRLGKFCASLPPFKANGTKWNKHVKHRIDITSMTSQQAAWCGPQKKSLPSAKSRRATSIRNLPLPALPMTKFCQKKR